MNIIKESIKGLHEWRLWTKLGKLELSLKYKRSKFGMSWVVLSFFIKVVGLAFVYSHVFGESFKEYLPYMALGIMLWNFMSSLIEESSTVFSRASNYILQMRKPLTLYIFADFYKELLTFKMNLLIFAVMVLFLKMSPGIIWLWSLAGFILLVINLYFLGIIIAFIATKYPDLKHFINSIMMIAFLVSPVLWKTKLAENSLILNLNPFYYWLEVIRSPILDNVIPLHALVFVSVFTIICSFMAYVVSKQMYKKMIYWI